jgi:RNA polymerase sigma factor (sigma-70 family)
VTSAGPTDTEHLLRALAPSVLGAVARRYGNFADAEDAVQEAFLTAATAWPADGVPDNPRAWLYRVATRRMVEQFRRDEARRRREDVTVGADTEPDPISGQDDAVTLICMCCHPALTPGSSIPLTLRAVGGLTTREIAVAFLVGEATMAQRISRAKRLIAQESFTRPGPNDLAARLRQVCHVLYLMFNEGYASTEGSSLIRPDLSTEAIRLTRMVQAELPELPELEGLLALMLLTEARRPARTGALGELIPLEQQDRTLWVTALMAEGDALITHAIARRALGEYQLQAAIAAEHDLAATYADTNWPRIASYYSLLDQLTDNPMVTLNRAVAVAMTEGPEAGLLMVDGLRGAMGEQNHRWLAVRAHLLELNGNAAEALVTFTLAASRATNQSEQHYLTLKAARLSTAT